jgi:peptidoglycan/LPS O-acetylase OafA/YrhL
VPEPVVSDRRYVAGLDGIRAVAVLAVIVYHLKVPGAGGGMLGVGVFFTLSGYLITDLLLSHWRRYGSLGLGGFWLRRARRLLPALFVMLAAISLWVALLDASQLAAVRRQVWAAAVYISNWSTIAEHGSYFARFAAPLPLDHLWSLAIEEQFYLVWPFLLLAGIWLLRTRRRMALMTLLLAALSAWWMAHLYHGGDPTRAYEGTDTRASGLLIGAALAMVWPPQAAAAVRPRATKVLDALGLAGLLGIIALVWGTSTFSSFLYPYGFLLLSFATAALVGAVVDPRSTLGSILGCTPLRWIGVRSYGIYLWHWPIVVLLLPAQSTFDPLWAAAAVAITFALAALSWRYVEEPIRHGALGRLWRSARAGGAWIGARRRALGLSGAAAVALLACGLGLSGMLPVASAGSRTAGRLQHVAPLARADSERVDLRSVRARPRALPNRTSCREVVYIGDSTSEGQITTEYLTSPRQRLWAQLARVGVHRTFAEISGARSIVETYQGHPNGATVAQNHISAGFRGCWILALGTNEVGNLYDGGIGYAPRIARMMKIIGRQPVLWVSAVTIVRHDDSYLGLHYSEPQMQAWNRALLKACRRYPTMRVFDWGAWVSARWFISDGIHYTAPGWLARNKRISQGLAHAFPAGARPSRRCLVR